MTGEILRSLLITSLAGSVLAGIILLLRPVTRKHFGYGWQYYIWLAVLAVLILPIRVSLPQDKAVAPFVQYARQTQEVSQTAETEPTPQEIAHTPAVQTAAPSKAELLWQKIAGGKVFCAVWLTGVCVFLLWYLIGYALMCRKIRKNSAEIACPELRQYTDKKVRVLSCGVVNVPFMTGVFRPVLILPKRAFTEEQLRNILRHETTHLGRRDILYKWFATLVKCVHWFNPVVWYAVRQINTECEISCDMSVIAEMNNEEETSYVDTILSMLSTRKTKAVPLTTGMAGSKKVIRRRLEMMKNKKRISKIMSVLSAVIAVVLLSTTVFASGVLAALAADDYTVEILNNGEKIELVNKPFIENDEVYVPIRETFEKVGAMEDETAYIDYDDGKVTVYFGDNYDGSDDRYELEIGAAQVIYNPSSELPNSRATREMNNAPILRNDITYIPYSYALCMLDIKYFIDYTIYDKNGNFVADNVRVVVTSPYENNTPQYTVDQFFQYFENGDFDNMKRYCTESCVNSFFGDGYCFGMTEAKLTNMEIEPSEYAKSSNDFVMSVSVTMTPYERSVYREGQTETAFYLILQRQSDGRYLIDEFATGL